MTLFQINLALVSFTIILVVLMMACLLYNIHAVKVRLEEEQQHKEG